ncbi:MAG: isochorismate synthase [Chroococcales cyanobacterium]
MFNFKWLRNMIESIGEGVSRIFSPNDDDYPETGVQPYQGEPNREKVEDAG